MGTTATVEVRASLHASAEDIWGLLTDEKRIPMWSRSPAKVGLTLPIRNPRKPGLDEIFGGWS